MKKWNSALALLLAVLMALSTGIVFAADDVAVYPAEATTEATTQATTQAATQATTQAATQAATEAATEAATQPATEPQEDDGEVITAFSDVDATTTVGKAVASLAARRIINGYPDGTFRPDGTITRAEFAVVITNFLGMGNVLAEDAVTGFYDLDADENSKWARPYVKIAVDKQIIAGFEDGSFQASAPVTYEQAVKMLVCALGYGPDAVARQEMLQVANPSVSWSTGYLAIANEKGVTKNVTSSGNDSQATRGTVAVLTYNCLSIPQRQTSSIVIVDENGNRVTGGQTANSALKTEDITGVVTGTYLTDIAAASSGAARGEIILNEDDTYLLSEKLQASVDLQDILGKRVTITYNTSDQEVTAINVRTKNTDTIDQFLLEDISGTTITYYANEEARYGGKTTRETLANDYAVIYNGKYYENFDLDWLTTEGHQYYLNNGSIELLTVSGSSPDLVKVTSYRDWVVDQVSKASEKVYLMYKETAADGTTSYTLPYPERGDVFRITRDGRDISEDFYSSVKKWDVLSIKESPEGIAGRRIYEMIVTRETVTGKVTALDSGDPHLIEINDKEYYFTDKFMGFLADYATYDLPESYSVGDTVAFYLNSDGRIAASAAADEVSSTTYKYGILLYAMQENSSDYPMDLYILDATSKTNKEMGAATKILLDGTSYTAKSDAALNYLLDSATAYYESSYSDGVSEQSFQQPIRYSVNTAGRVTAIDTVITDPDKVLGGDLTASVPYPGDTSTYSSNTFPDFRPSSTTKVIYVPDDRSAYDDYSVVSYSAVFSSGGKYHVEAFNIGSGVSKVPELILLYHENPATSLNAKSPFMIVTGSGSADGVDQLRGYLNGSSTVTTRTASEDFEGYEGSLDGDPIALFDIKVGDLVRFTTNSKGEILKLVRWYCAADPVQKQPVASLIDAFNSRVFAQSSSGTIYTTDTASAATTSFRLTYGTLVDLNVDDRALTTTITIAEDAEEGLEMVIDKETIPEGQSTASLITHLYPSSLKIFMYSNKSVQTDVNVAELRSYADFGADASKVIIWTSGNSATSSSYTKMIYIIE